MTALNRLFLESLQHSPARPFLRQALPSGELVSISCEQAAIHVARVIQALQSANIGRGDRVVAHLDATTPSIYFSLGCFHLGAVPAFLSPVFSLAAVEQLRRRLEAKAVWTGSRSDSRSGEGKQDWVRIDGVLAGDGLGSPQAARELLEGTAFDGAPDELCLIQPTSGSTGAPKLVATPQRSFLHVADTLLKGVQPLQGQHVLMTSPLTHGIGMCGLVAALLLEAELAVPSEHDTAARLEQVRELDPSFVYTTPRVLLALHRQLRDGSEALFGPRMQHVLLAGAPPDAALLETIARRGVLVREVYASSESGELVMTPPGHWRPGVTGRACSEVELRVDTDGELLARGPGQMLGYYDDPEATANSLSADGYYRTGDLARLTADGDVMILGRKKDVINSSEGMNIYPARIEEQLRHLPWVSQAVVAGDQKPFLTALIVVASGGSSGAMDRPGLPLTPEGNAQLYARAIADLKALNLQLESIERVHQVFLLSQPLPADSYRRVGLEKICVDRKAIEQLSEGWSNANPSSPHLF